MPMNNGNVTRAAIGVAQGPFDANFNANVKRRVTGGGDGAGEGGGIGAKKKPRRDAGAVIGGR